MLCSSVLCGQSIELFHIEEYKYNKALWGPCSDYAEKTPKSPQLGPKQCTPLHESKPM